MTGICYFANDDVDYFAEQQVNSIVNDIDDGATLIRESEAFSPELVDNLIEEAANKKCNKLVLMVEGKKYHQYSKIIPEVYGDMFESIEVVPENFVRVRESNNYDYYDGMEADAVFWADKYDEYIDAGMTDPDSGIVEFVAGKIDEDHPSDSPEQYDSLKRWVMSILKEKGYFKMPWMTEAVMRENDGVQTTAANGAAALPQNGQKTQQAPVQTYEKTTAIYFTDAVIPTAQNVLQFVNTHKTQGAQMTFMTIDSAHIYGASIPSIVSAYPQSQSSISQFAKNFNNIVPDFTLNTDRPSIVAAFAKALNLQARQDKVQIVFPRNYKDFANQLNAARGNVANIEFIASDKDNSMVNNYNENIFKIMTLFKDSKQALEKDPNRTAKWEKDDIGNKNKTVKENYKYINAIAAAMEYFEKNKDNKVKDRKSIQSAVLKALKDQFKQWSGYNNVKTEIKNNSAIGKFAFETAEKVSDAIKKDLQGGKKDKDNVKEDPTSRTVKSLYCWKYYEELCKMLQIKPE